MGSCAASVREGIVIKYLKSSFMFYQPSEYHVQKGARVEVLYLTPWWGDGDYQGQGEKKHQRNSRETGLDEEMWTVQAGRVESDGGRMKGEK